MALANCKILYSLIHKLNNNFIKLSNKWCMNVSEYVIYYAVMMFEINVHIIINLIFQVFYIIFFWWIKNYKQLNRKIWKFLFIVGNYWYEKKLFIIVVSFCLMINYLLIKICKIVMIRKYQSIINKYKFRSIIKK